jgi:hypothetical protein
MLILRDGLVVTDFMSTGPLLGVSGVIGGATRFLLNMSNPPCALSMA